MGELTVKDCFKLYPSMTDRDMAYLLGTSNYKDNTVISAAAVANYHGKNAEPLSIFYAKNATQKFVPLLSKSRQEKVTKQANIEPEKLRTVQPQSQSDNRNYVHFGSNDMNRSVFDIDKERRKRLLV